ncbi:hypothetical protein DFH08DRAFT_866938 [Mycena albidolilacea]|uniref:Uncharacterized protein n=1 Tax=Mycena albidolilacea TaxID=1033008 RepID=A0AAD7A365_9AGAR|nr:hypothetical protein DFH08DRAFT_866938 [Mycena albidolilacea]
MALRSAVRRLCLRPVYTQAHANALGSKMYSDVASTSKRESNAASAPPIAFASNTPTDYSALFRAFGHRRFSEGYRPNARPVALAQRNASLTPRQLYLKMCSGAKMRKSTETAVLATALRAFVRLGDYAAALVVLHALPVELNAAECARVTEAALHPLACRIYLERDSTRRRLTQALLGAPSLSAAGWGLGAGAWSMPERAGWLITRVLKHNTPKAEAKLLEEEELQASLRPLAFILKHMLRIHGGVSKRKTARSWRDEEARAKREMDPKARLRRKNEKSKRSSASSEDEPVRPRTRQEIPLWTDGKL